LDLIEKIIKTKGFGSSFVWLIGEMDAINEIAVTNDLLVIEEMQPNLMALLKSKVKSQSQEGIQAYSFNRKKSRALRDGGSVSDDDALWSHPVDAELWFGGKIHDHRSKFKTR
jgi:dTDP-4-amino-4,6-dideoxygalactose transaminase